MPEKQQEIPGTERPAIKEIDRAAEKLREVRSARMDLTKEEAKQAGKLQALLEKHGLKLYMYESDDTDDAGDPIMFDVLLDDEPKVKVRKHKDKKITAEEGE